MDNQENHAVSSHHNYWTGLHDLITFIEASEQAKHVILLDQFEELFLENKDQFTRSLMHGNQEAITQPLLKKSERVQFEEALIQLIQRAVDHYILHKNTHALLKETIITKDWEKLINIINGWEDKISESKKSMFLEQIDHGQNGELSASALEKLSLSLSEAWDSVDPQQLLLLLTMRSDFEWQFENSRIGKEIETYAKLLSGDRAYLYRYRLAPMGLDELRDALIGPALIRGFEFESEEIVGEILEEIGYAPAALPLLSLCMKNLFHLAEQKIKESGEDNRVFTRTMYREELGGISGALTTMVDTFYEGLVQVDISLQRDMQKLFLRMLRLNNGDFSRRKFITTSTFQGMN